MRRSTADGLQKVTADYDEPPYCASLNPKKPLLLYLATNQCAIGAMIAQEDGDDIEQPVYYISHALKDTETRYPRAEKRYCVYLAKSTPLLLGLRGVADD